LSLWWLLWHDFGVELAGQCPTLEPARERFVLGVARRALWLHMKCRGRSSVLGTGDPLGHDVAQPIASPKILNSFHYITSHCITHHIQAMQTTSEFTLNLMANSWARILAGTRRAIALLKSGDHSLRENVTGLPETRRQDKANKTRQDKTRPVNVVCDKHGSVLTICSGSRLRHGAWPPLPLEL
jgi:hypothetical protein